MMLSSNAPLYSPCARCQGGKIEHFPKQKKIQITVLALVFLVGFLLFMVGGSQLLQFKLGPDNPPIKIKSPGALLTGVGAILMALMGVIAYFLMGIVKQLKGWFFLECPYCEEGYIKSQEVGYFKATLFFLDQFLFHEILIPMYHAITFRKFWSAENRKLKFLFVLKMLFYLFIFFGSIPFLVFLLGTKQSFGLLFSFGVMFYLLVLIFSMKEEDTHQRGVIFLMVPLYYVSMVEIFRWAWVVSAQSFVPDMSDFLFLGLENLIRTQLFVDFFEVYDLPLADIEETSFLAHTAIFCTRLLLDAAIITMIIRAFLYSFRRSWIYKHTGENTTQMSDPDALLNLENLTISRHPKKMEEVLQNLQEVTSVLQNTQKYVTTVNQTLKGRSSAENLQASLECEKILGDWQFPESQKEETKERLHVSVLDRVLATLIMAIWSVAFLFGLNYFIHDLTQREIAFLMDQAETEKYQQDPFKRMILYERVLKKDAKHEQGLLKSAGTMLDIADRRVDLFALDQGERDIDNFFQRVLTLERLAGLDSPYQKTLREMAGRAYVARGKIFFLRGDLNRSIAELNKENSDDLRRTRYGVAFYEACDRLLTQGATEEDFEKVLLLLGEVPDPSSRVLAELGVMLAQANQKKLAEALMALERFLNHSEMRCSPPLKLHLELLLVRGWSQQNRLEEAKEKLQTLLKQDSVPVMATLENAHWLRQQNKWAEASSQIQEFLPHASGSALNKTLLLQGVLQYLQNEQDLALTTFGKVWAREGVQENLRAHLTFFLQHKISAEEMENRLALQPLYHEEQTAVAHFYLGLVALSEKRFSQAGKHFAFCSTGAESFVEVDQARRELVLLQLQFEKQSYDARFLFPLVRISTLTKQLQEEIRLMILPAHKVLQALEWAGNSSSDSMRSESLVSVAQANILASEQILPALRKGLQDESLLVKQAALEGLLTLGADSAKLQEEVFLILALQAPEDASPELMDQIQQVKRTAVKVMESFGEASVNALTKALEDTDKYIRRDAGYALARLKEKAISAKEMLTQKLEDPEVIVRDAAFEAIANLGKDGVPVLLHLLEKSSHSSLVIQAIKVLQKSYPSVYLKEKTKIIPFFLKALTTDKDPETRRYAAQQLIRLGVGPESVPDKAVQLQLQERLQELLRTSDPLKQVAGALALLAYGTAFDQEVKEAQDFCEQYLQKLPTEKQKEFLAVLSAPEYRKKSFSLLFVTLQKKDKELKRYIERIFQGFREEGEKFAPYLTLFFQNLVDHLLLVEDEEGIFFEWGIQYLNSFFNELAPEAIPPMFALLHHPRASVHEAVLEAWNSDFEMTPELQKSILKGLNSTDSAVKKSHFTLLLDLEVEDESILPLMKESLSSEEPEVVAAALKFLSQNTNDVGEKEMARVEEILSSEQEDFEEAQENAFLLFGAKNGTEALSNYLKAKEPNLQLLAIKALGKLYRDLDDEAEQEKLAKLFLRFLKGNDADVVAETIQSIMEYRVDGEGFDKELNRLAKGKNEDLQEPAKEALLRRDPGSYLPELKTRLQSDDPDEVLQTLNLLGSLDEIPFEFVEVLIVLSQHSSSKIVPLANEYLADLKNETLFQLLDATKESSVVFALKRLKAKGKKAKSALSKVQALVETKPSLGLLALQTWGDITAQTWTEQERAWLLKQTEATSLDVQIEAHYLLAKGGQEESLKQIRQFLRQPQLSSERAESVVEKLAMLRPVEALPFLTQTLISRYSTIRPVFAIRLIGKLGKSAETALPVLKDLLLDPNPMLQVELAQAITRIEK